MIPGLLNTVKRDVIAFPDANFMEQARCCGDRAGIERKATHKIGFCEWDLGHKLTISYPALHHHFGFFEDDKEKESKNDDSKRGKKKQLKREIKSLFISAMEGAVIDGPSRSISATPAGCEVRIILQKRLVVRRCPLRGNKEELLVFLSVDGISGEEELGIKKEYCCRKWSGARLAWWALFWGQDINLNDRKPYSRKILGRKSKKAITGDEEKEPLLLG